MTRLLLLIGLVVLVALWWFGKGRRGGARAGHDGAVAEPPMAACARCGLHLPQAESLEGEGGLRYCCAEHRRLGPAD